MPVYRKQDARKGGWAQVREALQSFEGDVIRVEEGKWGGKLVDEEGNPLPPKEFFEIETVNNVPLEVIEDLTMDIADRFSFRVNMSEWDGSFWVDEFLASAEKFGILLPDGLKGKKIVFKKVTKHWEIDGIPRSYTNYVIAEVMSPGVAPKIITKSISTPIEETVENADDPMALALELAVGKTEAQFRSAIAFHPQFVGSPLLPLAKAGAITAALVKDGKLVEVREGSVKVYRKV